MGMVNVGGVAKASIGDACDSTATDDTCSHTCAAGYTGGSVTCGSDGAWVVVDCTADTTTCDAAAPATTNMANMVNVGGVAKASIGGACNGTATDATCAHTCAAGYTGGS